MTLPDGYLGTAMRAYRSGSNTSQGVNWTTVPCNTIDFDVDNNFNTSNGLYTVPQEGYYQVNGRVRTTVANTPQVVSAGIIYNSASTPVSAGGLFYPGTGITGGGYAGGDAIAAVVTDILHFKKNDTVALGVFNNGGNPISVAVGANETYFSIAKIL